MNIVDSTREVPSPRHVIVVFTLCREMPLWTVMMNSDKERGSSHCNQAVLMDQAHGRIIFTSLRTVPRLIVGLRKPEHAAAINIELRRRVTVSGEALHSLRDNIYEKVSFVYADRRELKQEAISVEIFINALANVDVVQKLLEEHPSTLAKAYEITHHYETTKRAARAVAQLMQPSLIVKIPPAEAAIK